jgi:anti-sigma regulatory factor (Ser/Thr protein kinase)
MGVALHEALTNAMFHGNLELDSALRDGDPSQYYRLAAERRGKEPYSARRVHVCLRETAESSQYIVRDEGSGFDVLARRPDPTDASNLHRASGRGLFLIHMFMDDVSFNEAGNEITMVHHRARTAE